MIDHIYLPVTDLIRSVDFYASVLGELGWRVMGTHESTTEGVPSLYGFYAPNLSSIWLDKSYAVTWATCPAAAKLACPAPHPISSTWA